MDGAWWPYSDRSRPSEMLEKTGIAARQLGSASDMPLLHTLDRTTTGTDTKRHTPLSKLLGVSGALGVAVAAVLPWMTVNGRLPLDLGIVGAQVSVAGRTVTGPETAAWPYLLGLAAVAALLAGLGIARKLLLALGALTMVAAGGLLYYLANVVDIETADRSPLERAAADLALTTSVGPGPYVLLGAGALILLGAAGSRRR